ncbi:MAG: acyltransferase [Frankiales bacterium]|nr:acyltransferase [Frankiales bacterium]
MVDRLSPLDASFLYFEGPVTPMHVGGVAVFDLPAAGFDYETLADLIEARISLVPRYRQKIRWVPGHLANPVWVDDGSFDLSYHLRRSALPRPGSDAQLRELVARVQSRALDRRRPLWEMYLVEGLSDERIAIITKTHHAMVDGISAVDIAQVILDVSPVVRELPPDDWTARPEPTAAGLVLDAVTEIARRPSALVDTVRLGLADARSTAENVTRTVGGLLSAARAAARPAPGSPLNLAIGPQRRFAVARTDLADYRRIREKSGGTVNDVLLATIAGAIRGWLLSRGEPVTPASVVRAMVPVSVRSEAEGGRLGNRVSSYLVDLPVGEPNPVVRLSQVTYAMQAHKESGQSVGAATIVALSGFAPPTLHAMGARVASSFSSRVFNLIVTNVPGPQFPLFASGARMLEMFPVVPLPGGQALAIGSTSYNGGIYYGLNADREAMYDVDVIASLIEESLAELVDASRASVNRRD